MCYPRTLGEAESVRLGRWVGFRQENKGLIWRPLSSADAARFPPWACERHSGSWKPQDLVNKLLGNTNNPSKSSSEARCCLNRFFTFLQYNHHCNDYYLLSAYVRYYCLHFIGERTGAQRVKRLAQDHTPSKGCWQNLNPGPLYLKACTTLLPLRHV